MFEFVFCRPDIIRPKLIHYTTDIKVNYPSGFYFKELILDEERCQHKILLIFKIKNVCTVTPPPSFTTLINFANMKHIHPALLDVKTINQAITRSWKN